MPGFLRYDSRRPAGGIPRRGRRLFVALAASVVAHAWVASELPLGAPPGRAYRPPIVARLEPGVPGLQLAAAGGVPPAPSSEASVLPPPSRVRPRRPDPAAAPSAEQERSGETAKPALRDDAAYYPARQLDVYPSLLSPLDVVYPERALAEQRSGKVLVLLRIGATGKVDDASVIEAEPPGYFEDAALKTFESAAFAPGRKAGVPVGSRVLIHLEFDPRSRKAAAP